MMKNITTVCTEFASGSPTLLAVAEIPPGAPHAGVVEPKRRKGWSQEAIVAMKALHLGLRDLPY
jgi:hypothetical protein